MLLISYNYTTMKNNKKTVYIVNNWEEAIYASENREEAISVLKSELVDHCCCNNIQVLKISKDFTYDEQFWNFFLFDENWEEIEFSDFKKKWVKIEEKEQLSDWLNKYAFVNRTEINCCIQDYFEEIRKDVTYYSDLSMYEQICDNYIERNREKFWEDFDFNS